jgi:hypothetical protein
LNDGVGGKAGVCSDAGTGLNTGIWGHNS